MSRRIEIELTSTRDDGSWTWRAAGAREPKGTLDGEILPAGASVGDVVRAEVEGFLDGLNVVSIVPPRAPRSEPERIELRTSRRDETPLVTSDVRRRSSSSSERRRPERGRRRDEAGGDRSRRDRDRDRGDRGDRDRDRGDRDRDRQAGRHDRGRGDRPGRGERSDRPAVQAEAVESKPKPKRLRPARTHRAALLESLPSEQRPIAEQLLQGGIPAVRQAIDKQNESLRAEGKPEVGRDSLLKVAEDIRPRALAALWRDRAEAAVASVDELDLRDLRSVVNAAADAGRDEEARSLANQLREALVNRVEKEHSAWLAELSDTLRDGRVVRALRLSSRPPKAGAPIPTELTNQLADAAAAALTEETGQDRWATVLDALAYSPVRRRVIPQSLPVKLSPSLRETVARLGSRLPEIAHIFDIEPAESPGRTGPGSGPRPPRRARGGSGGGGAGGGGGRPGDRPSGGSSRRRSGGGGGSSSGSGGTGAPRSRRSPSDPRSSSPESPSTPEAPEARSSATPPESPADSAPAADSSATAPSVEESPTEPAAPSVDATPPPAESPAEPAPAVDSSATASSVEESPAEPASAVDSSATASSVEESPAEPASAAVSSATASSVEESPAEPAAPSVDATPQAEQSTPADAAPSEEPSSPPAAAEEPSSSAGLEPSAEAASTAAEPEPQPAAGTGASAEPERQTTGEPEAAPVAENGDEGATRSPVIEAGTMPADESAS